MIDVCKSRKDVEKVTEEGLTTAFNNAGQQTKKTEVPFQILHNYPVKCSAGECQGWKIHTVVFVSGVVCGGFVLVLKA